LASCYSSFFRSPLTPSQGRARFEFMLLFLESCRSAVFVISLYPTLHSVPSPPIDVACESRLPSFTARSIPRQPASLVVSFVTRLVFLRPLNPENLFLYRNLPLSCQFDRCPAESLSPFPPSNWSLFFFSSIPSTLAFLYYFELAPFPFVGVPFSRDRSPSSP